ncbi:MAG: hypothetical protein H6739_41925 [Alphaproteobacteria bacterium]|nr:hypothetical protein [Alphaproteobacteria bacterium]
MTRSLLTSTALLAALVACDGEAPPTEPADPPAPTVAPTPLSADDLKGAQAVALVPSPVEMHRALQRAGVAKGLADRVPSRTMAMDVDDRDRVAVRTGVVMADLMLTAGNAETSAISAHIKTIRAGVATLGARPDTLAALDDLDARVSNDAISRDDLIKELDEMAGSRLPEIEDQLGERALPLIRAGSWVEGANLVSGALLDKGDFTHSTALLKHPAVVEYFQGYVKTEGREIVDGDVLVQLETSLATLDEVCAKDVLAEDDVKAIHQATTAVLELL